MALNSPSDITNLLLCIILFTSIHLVYKKWNKQTSQKGFKAPRRLPQRERIFGVSLLEELTTWSKTGTYLQNSRARFEENGYTYSMVLAGSTMIQTAEPENIKAVLGAL
jgi:hypothetical protein